MYLTRSAWLAIALLVLLAGVVSFAPQANAASYQFEVGGSGTVVVTGPFPSMSALKAANHSGWSYSAWDTPGYPFAMTCNRTGSTNVVPDCPYNGYRLLISRTGDSCADPNAIYNPQTGDCDAPPQQCPGDAVLQPDGSCALECEAPTVPNPVTMTCDPPPMCPEGQYWDFETEACKWPQDDNCPTGSNWSPSLNDCVCDGDGVLSNAQGFRICMPPAADECTPDSPDFKGYYNGYRPFCSGEARCPPGTTYGAVGKGDYLEHVCIPNQPPEDPDCPDGTVGNMGGKNVCVPKFGEDPDCPSGQSGMVGGEKVCLPMPDDPDGCQPGETPGYVGKGDQMEKVCVPKGYGPPTCKAGTYPINNGNGGFSCVPVTGGAGPGGTDTGNKPKPGDGSGGDGDGDGGNTGGGGGSPGEGESETEVSTVGGESCATELRCQGDAIQCAILRKQKDQVCQWKFDGEVQAQVEASVSGEGYQLQEKQIGVGSLFSEALNQGRWLPSSCPAPRSVNILGRSYAFEWEPLCHFAESLGPLIVALASIFFAVFIGRGIKGA